LGDFTVVRTASNSATRVNAQGFIETVADNVPRIDYPIGGIVAGCPSLLVEPAATNGIRNNSMVGAVAGTPGNLPTNWSNAGSGLTRQSIVTGTLNGIPYVDIRISGTANNTFHDVFWDVNNIIAASVGQNWVASCYLQIIAQPNPPVNYVLAMREFNSGGGFLSVFPGPALSISTTSFDRFSFTRALNQATVAFVHPSLFLTLVSGQTYDFTIRIGYPQMEIGSVATSVIHTTTAAINRGAETISKTGVSSLIGQTEGTIYAEVDMTSQTAIRTLMTISDGTITNRIRFRFTTATNLEMERSVSGSANASLNVTVPASGVSKIALGYNASASGFVIYVNGSSAGTIAAATPTFTNQLTRIDIGSNIGSAPQFNDRIRAVAIYPTRIPNTAPLGVLSLQSLTQ
jgi:hypothetical protein